VKIAITIFVIIVFSIVFYQQGFNDGLKARSMVVCDKCGGWGTRETIEEHFKKCDGKLSDNIVSDWEKMTDGKMADELLRCSQCGKFFKPHEYWRLKPGNPQYIPESFCSRKCWHEHN